LKRVDLFVQRLDLGCQSSLCGGTGTEGTVGGEARQQLGNCVEVQTHVKEHADPADPFDCGLGQVSVSVRLTRRDQEATVIVVTERSGARVRDPGDLADQHPDALGLDIDMGVKVYRPSGPTTYTREPIVTVDVHAHVTNDPAGQLERATRAGVDRTVLLSTRVHPEAAETPDQVRAEFARLGAVIGGAASSRQVYQAAMDELRLALNAHPDTTVGFVNVSLDQPVEDVHAWIASYLAEPQIVGIGELTPAPGAAGQIEPVLQVSADHAGVPVLTHGSAPNTSDDLTTYANLAGRYPSVPLIVGAFGGLNCLQLIDLTREHPNLYIDLSSALQVFAVRAAINEVPEQCLFGSNTPYGDVLASRTTIEAAITAPSVLHQVLHDNTARLLTRVQR